MTEKSAGRPPFGKVEPTGTTAHVARFSFLRTQRSGATLLRLRSWPVLRRLPV